MAQNYRSMSDTKRGWYAMRSGWSRWREILTTIYAKHTAGGGWSFAEAGGIRLIGLGSLWGVRGASGEDGGRGNGGIHLDNVVNSISRWLDGSTDHCYRPHPTRGGGTVDLDMTSSLWGRLDRNKQKNDRSAWQTAITTPWRVVRSRTSWSTTDTGQLRPNERNGCDGHYRRFL